MDDAAQKELLSLRKRGVLRAEDVVKAARNPKSALHSHFEWDNTKAGKEYRLIQARKLIVSVTIVPTPNNRPIRAFVSLKSDRHNGGGYREQIDVLSDADLRKQLLAQALDDFVYWADKYRTLRELRTILEAGRKVMRRHAKPKKAKKPTKRADSRSSSGRRRATAVAAKRR